MILDKIVDNKKAELIVTKGQTPLEDLIAKASQLPRTLDFGGSLKGDQVRLIAEIKKASPSKGLICRDFEPLKTAGIYAGNGAAAISVLTEVKHFQGKLEYLRQIRTVLGPDCPPLLRKDFILEPYQVYESRAFGADAILLIVAVLGYRRLVDLLQLSVGLGLQCLVEVHTENEVAVALAADAQIIGINNRNLRTFEVDLETTARLRSLVPPEKIVVSESGIRTRQDMLKLKQWGVQAALVGETLMAAADVGAKMRELL